MTIDDKIRDEKLKYDSNREAANISTLSHSGRNTTIWPKESDSTSYVYIFTPW